MKENDRIIDSIETVTNGYTDRNNSGSSINSREVINYYNPLRKNSDNTVGGMQTQNFLDLDDILVPVIIRRNKLGELEFALQYEYIPAINKIHLELPDFPITERSSSYKDDTMQNLLDSKLNELGMSLIVSKKYDFSLTPVSQSFTNQRVNFVAAFVDGNNSDKSIQWFPLSSLQSYFEKIGNNSSLVTQYGLRLLKNDSAFSKNIFESYTEFNPSDLLGKNLNVVEQKVLFENKHRFGVMLSKVDKNDLSDNIRDFGEYSEYGISKNSCQCLLLKNNNGKYQIGLSRQQRSPFVMMDGMDENLYEISAGMLEEGEEYSSAAIREAKEETGIIIDKSNLKYCGEVLLSKATQEYSGCYICELDEIEKTTQNLDEDESVEEIKWYDLDKINLDEKQFPLATKYMILRCIEYINEKEFVKDNNIEESLSL